MQIGTLDRRLAIQQATETQNGLGEPVASWATIALVWGAKINQRAAERFTARQTLAENMVIWRIRWRDDVTEKMRVLTMDGKLYRIEGIVELGRREGLDLSTVAIVP